MKEKNTTIVIAATIMNPYDMILNSVWSFFHSPPPSRKSFVMPKNCANFKEKENCASASKTPVDIPIMNVTIDAKIVLNPKVVLMNIDNVP